MASWCHWRANTLATAVVGDPGSARHSRTGPLTVDLIWVPISRSHDRDVKTTIDIADALMAEVKAAAAQDGRTVRSLVEGGLRKQLAERVFPVPTPLPRALEQVVAWQESGAVFLAEAARHRDRLAGLLVAGGVTGPKIQDARIAALRLDHGVDELWSSDRDFSRFPALRVRNPLVKPRPRR